MPDPSKLFPLTASPSKFKAMGFRQPGYSSVARWAKHGIRGVKLAVVVIGGTAHTSADAIIEFGAAVARAKYGGSETPPAAAARRSREIDAAVADLRKKKRGT